MGGASSKEEFITSFNKLQKETVPFSSDLWDKILSQPIQDEDNYLENFKKLKNERPENLANFIKKLVNQLVLVKGIQREKNTQGDFQLTLISLSYLSRIIPIIFEGGDDFSDRLFWYNQEIEPLSHPTATISTSPVVTTNIVQDNENQNDPKDSEKKEGEQQPKEEKTEEKKEINEPKKINNNENSEILLDETPLAIKLMDSLLDLLFFPGFTVSESLGLKSPKETSPDSIPPLYSWVAGFGIDNVPTVSNKQMWLNRLSVLQCLISCLSEQLYVPQENVSSFKSKWLDWFTNTQDYYTETLLFSLINTFSTYDPIGWGIPYNHLMYADDHEACSKLSLQILNILLTYDPYTIDDHLLTSNKQTPSSSSKANELPQHECKNRFIIYIKTLKRVRDFKFFFNAFERIMNLPIIASHTKLPNSTKKIELHQDLLITFWRFISHNHDFLKSIVNYETSPEFIVPILQYMDEGRKSQTTHGIVQIGTFILLVLSGERDFSISLNKPFNSKVYIDIVQPQVYSDFVIMVLYRLLVDTPDRLESIYECVLTILTNLSPYMKNLSMVTCVKLMKLFEYLSGPRFLFSNSHNYRYVGFLLESLNNLLQHQYESNTRLIYAILRCQNQFSKLAYLKISPITPVKNFVGGKLDQITQPSPATTAEEAFGKINKLSISEQDHQDELNKNKTHQPPTTEHPPNTINNDEVNDNNKQNEDKNEDKTTTTTTTLDTTDDQSKLKNNSETIQSGSGTPVIKAFSSTTPSESSPNLNSSVDSKQQTPQQIDSLSSSNASTPNKQTIKTPMYSQFLPTDEWLQDIKKQLPLDNILKVITHLSPQIQGLCTGSGSDEQKIMDYLKMSTIVGIFHNPGPIMTRKYHSNTVTKSWFIAYMWCIIYLENRAPPLFLHTDIKLFQVKQ
ncbi:hypothetical protein DICPUDRAFT_92564 [Dictyostelium purpureum]|uniref:HID1 domain-containing protein n=1 Tax=Dictyostelium purpureum TaxID=5786 RepID=F0ZTT1_DICPU|nr:uncharacterized protein DICPUDRAFT_92564 [Dictyostelium purpureum]EGC32662.1 hypothetical protein DICPUDRAFT_92564 [Dictyostelium purpureum]|eukprot:XP_003290831.1 hypothetical protein DICPUDRAFT_92564 [Dictyostelium purpureum]